jgi:hypothetical protein
MMWLEGNSSGHSSSIIAFACMDGTAHGTSVQAILYWYLPIWHYIINFFLILLQLKFEPLHRLHN